MAWISVYEQVIGGKLRKLSKEIGCSQNEALGILVRLWLWAINNAGKDGYIVGADKDDVSEILNIGIDRRYKAYEVVDALITTGWIDMENGLYLHDWEEWQGAWYKAMETRERDAARKREERKRKRMAKALEEQVAPSKERPDRESMEQKPASGYSKDFEEFWMAYPRKLGKGEAYKKYKARLNDGWSEKELLEAAKNYASRVARERTEQMYIKHAKTFLSESTPFIDFLPEGNKNGKQEASDCDNPYADWRN